MSLIDRLGRSFKESPKAELKHAFARKEHPTYYKLGSFRGRGASALNMPAHLGGIFLKPLAYIGFAGLNATAGTVLMVCSAKQKSHRPLLKREAKNCYKQAVRNIGCGCVAPIGQIAALAKAAAGAVFHPGAYFKKPNPAAQNAAGIQAAHVSPRDVSPSFGSSAGRGWNEGCYYHNTEKAAPRERPQQELAALANGIRALNAGDLRVSYTDEVGVDVGGVRRDYLDALFRSLACTDKFPIEEGILDWSEEINGALKDIGTVFRMLLSQKERAEEIHTGEYFHPAYFQGLLAFSHEEIHADFDKISPERLLDLLCQATADARLRALYQSARSVVNWKGPGPLPEDQITFLRDLRETYGFDMPEGAFDATDKFNQAALAEVKKLLVTQLPHEYAGARKLHALHAIAKGINCTAAAWAELQAEGAETMRIRIQGVFSKEILLASIDYSPLLSPAVVHEIDAWIRAQDDETLKRFLVFATGLSTVPAKGITFKPSVAVQGFFGHACGSVVDIQHDIPVDSVGPQLSYCSQPTVLAGTFDRL